MPYYRGDGALRSEKGPPTRTTALGNPNQFRFDLTEDQKRFCAWVAQQTQPEGGFPTRLSALGVPVRQIRYTEATAALQVPAEQLTRMLREMRERLDEIHAMVEAPITNTPVPYFEVPVQAHYIWDNYRRAEKERENGARVEPRTLELVEC